MNSPGIIYGAILLMSACPTYIAVKLSTAKVGTGAGSTCADDWIEFGNAPLEGVTRVSDSASTLSSSQLDSMHDLYVHPESNFAFCSIPRSGSSAWDTVFWKMFLNDTSYKAGQDPDHHEIGKKSQEKAGIDAIKALFKDPSATRAVFVRDPLERIVSAFFNECFGNGCKSERCWVRKVDQDGKPIAFRQAVESILQREANDIPSHWKLQSSFCGMQSDVDHFNVIGLMNPQTYGEDATCLLEFAHLSRFNVKGPDNPTPLWTDIPLNHYEKGGQPTDVLKRLFTKEQARNLISLFAQDYKVFRLPEPAWVAHATGEWYDKLPDGCWKLTDEWRKAQSDEHDTEDLVELASLIGYPDLRS